MALLTLLMIAVFVFHPSNLWAWGPITHMDFANAALSNLSVYPTAVKMLLEAFRFDFLYGALAADITLGKDYVDYVYNCHNWKVGFSIFKKASGDRQKAAALGYLSHLAVDIISHNFYVPYKTIRSYPTRTLGHVYWEMRFDARCPREIWELAHQVGQMSFPHDDELFEGALRRTIFSFKTNRKIFRSVLTLHRLRHWQTMIKKVQQISRFPLLEKDYQDYRKLAIESVIAFLKDPEGAPCTRVDPTGAGKLEYADHTRRELKKLYRQKLISAKKASDFLVQVKVALRETIYQPGELPLLKDWL